MKCPFAPGLPKPRRLYTLLLSVGFSPFILVIISVLGVEPLAKLLGCGSAQSSDSQGEHPIVLDFDCVFWS